MNIHDIIIALWAHLKFFILGLGIAFGIYSLRYFKAFMLWIKGGVEDGDGTLENKELQIAFFSILAAFIVVSVPIWEIEYPDSIIYCTFAGAGILYAVNRGASAYENVNGKGEDSKEEDEGHY